jgi:3-oxoacyl-[acyl-carrier-protein] synthase-3
MFEVYITKTSSFLPNNPVSNDEIEDYLGLVNGTVSKTKALILRNNKIEQRYYAIDKKGNPTHTNGEMVSLAIKKILNEKTSLTSEIDLLCCGTSTPDYLMPSHGIMVHGLVSELNNIEVVSPSGNCCSGMQALKYAYLALKIGEKTKAISTGSERLSRNLRAENYEEEVTSLNDLNENPILAFEKDFIRWMLSDGASAFLLETQPSSTGPSLKIEWIEFTSFANKAEVCMYMGGDKDENGEFISYKDFNPKDLLKKSIFSIKQDTKLLGEKIVPLGVEFLRTLFDKHNFSLDDLTYFLPHLSSFYFEDKIDEELKKFNLIIPKEKWFTNLKYKGNVGSGSIYLMIDELMNSGKLQKGQKILLMVPESARFSYVYCLLTVC